MERPIGALGIVLAGLAVLLAGCGGSGGGEDASVPATATPATATPATATSTTGTVAQQENDGDSSDEPIADSTDADPTNGGQIDETGDEESAAESPPGPATLEEYQTLWAENRQKTIDRIVGEGYGRQGDRIVGPDGFEVDLSACGAGWDDLGGVTDEVIPIGMVVSLSGPPTLALDQQLWAVQTYVDWVNAEDPIGDRRLELVVEDGGFGPPQSLEAMERLLGTSDVLAVTTARGSSQIVSQDLINQSCVVNVGHDWPSASFGDTIANPWTVSIDLSSATEILAWCDALGKTDGPLDTVGLLITEDENRPELQSRLTECVEGDLGAELLTVVHDPTEDPLDAANELRQMSPDASLVHLNRGTFGCQQVLETVGSRATASGRQFVSQACGETLSFAGPEGWATFASASKQMPGEPSTDPYMRFVYEQLGSDNLLTMTAYSFSHFSWFLVEATRIADGLPGGLTRSNLLIAMRSFDTPHPALQNGMSFQLSGNRDTYGDETVVPVLIGPQGWETIGPPLDLNGRTQRPTNR